MQGFWAKLPKPFFILAPLANVTDAAFRRVIAHYSKPAGPNAFFTEFVSADGLARGNKDILMRDLTFSQAERPIVAQFFTSTPEYMEQAAALARELGFDGVDINMGCPDRAVEKQGAGAKLILNPERAAELIVAAKRGAGELPVSVKTRLGYNKDSLEEPASTRGESTRGGWLPALLRAEPAAITVHARTRKEMSLVPARWERVKRAVEIRNELKSKTLIIGNGDVRDIPHAKERVEETGVDGVMIGRGIFGKPWLFSGKEEPTLKERLQIAIEHTRTFQALLGDIKNFAIMKKHFKAYVEGFPGAKELRIELMKADNAAEVETVINNFSRTLQ